MRLAWKVFCCSMIMLWGIVALVFGNWPNHRGDSSLHGVSSDILGEELLLKWTFEAGKFLKSSPVLWGGKVFFGGPTGSFYAVDASSGTEVWKADAGIGVDAPALVHEEKVYVGTKDGWLICFDANNGKKLWSYETLGEIVGAPNHTVHPQSKESLILIGSYDNFLHCVNAKNGSLLWQFETMNYVNGTPAIWNQHAVVFGGCDAQMYVVSLSDGQLIRQVDLGAPIASSVGVIDSLGYVGNMDKSVQAIDLETGKIVWNYETRNFPYFSSPALNEDLVIIGGRDKGLHAIERNTGKQKWRFSARGRIDGSPVIAGQKVVVGSMDGKLYQIDLQAGTIINQYEIGASISTTCAVSDGWIFVGCEDGNLYAFITRK